MDPANRDLLKLVAEDRRAVIRVLERAYPLAQELAEVLELEAVEPLATDAKRIRQGIGAMLGDLARFR